MNRSLAIGELDARRRMPSEWLLERVAAVTSLRVRPPMVTRIE